MDLLGHVKETNLGLGSDVRGLLLSKLLMENHLSNIKL